MWRCQNAGAVCLSEEGLIDQIKVITDKNMAFVRYVYKYEWVKVAGRQGNWCQLDDGNQIFCGCVSGYNAGLGCR